MELLKPYIQRILLDVQDLCITNPRHICLIWARPGKQFRLHCKCAPAKTACTT